MPAVQHRLVSWRQSLLHRTIGSPPPADDPELEKKLALEAVPARPATGGKAADEPTRDDKDDELELDDDDDDEDLVVFTAKEAAGAMATIYGFVRPYLGNYRKLVALRQHRRRWSRRCSTSSCR